MSEPHSYKKYNYRPIGVPNAVYERLNKIKEGLGEESFGTTIWFLCEFFDEKGVTKNGK